MDLKDIKTKRLSDIEKKIFFLAWLNGKLKAAESRAFPVLVGGSAVQLYTGGNYMSIDMDIYLDDISPAVKLLEEQGFVRAERHYFSAEYDLLAEFVGGDMPEKISEITAVQDSSNLKMPSCNSKALLIVIGRI